MPVDLISEEELRLALKPHRVDPQKFEAAVHERLQENEGLEYNPTATMSPLLKTAAGLLPLELFAASQTTGAAVKSAPVAGILSKLLGVAAFPAISLFVLLGATIFSALKIRKIQRQSDSGQLVDEQAAFAGATRWWRGHWWGSLLLYIVTFAMCWFGATWLLFLGYIVSTLVLLYILKGFARAGIGSRQIVGQSCVWGLLLLGQSAGFAGIGNDDIHMLNQVLLVPLFFMGAFVVLLISNWGSNRKRSVRVAGTVVFGIVGALVVWFVTPPIMPVTAAQIRRYVESFDRAEFSSASWRQWEIAAAWTARSSPPFDLSRPRQLLEKEIARQDETLPYILDIGFKFGLVGLDHVGQLKDYQTRLGSVLEAPASARMSPGYDDWVIRAAVLRNDLTPAQRDHVAKRLHENLKWSLTRKAPGTLDEPLRATQLLEVIGRPVEPTQYQAEIQAMLRRFHSKTGAGFTRAGGFRPVDLESARVGSIEATADAIGLMEYYGIPQDLDMNWVRSFLRPSSTVTVERWMAAATLARPNELPGTTRPPWPLIVYYERSFLAAVFLIGLCIYATVISPKPLRSM